MEKITLRAELRWNKSRKAVPQITQKYAEEAKSNKSGRKRKSVFNGKSTIDNWRKRKRSKAVPQITQKYAE